MTRLLGLRGICPGVAFGVDRFGLCTYRNGYTGCVVLVVDVEIHCFIGFGVVVP